MSDRGSTAPVSHRTVTVLGSHWKASAPWDGLDFRRAEIRHRSIWSNDDYHLRVPWMHPRDREMMADDPDCWAHYRVRPKRGWHSFVRIAGERHVSKAQAAPRDPNEPWPSFMVLEITETDDPSESMTSSQSG